MLLRSRRTELHAAIGEVIESAFPEMVETEPELLAHHFAEAEWCTLGEGREVSCRFLSCCEGPSTSASGHLRKSETLPVASAPGGEADVIGRKADITPQSSDSGVFRHAVTVHLAHAGL